MSEVQTHNENCWRDPRHHACAVRLIKELEEQYANLYWAVEGLDFDTMEHPKPVDPIPSLKG